MKFSDFMSWGGAFDPLFCPEGRVFVHSDCPGRGAFALFKSCPGGMVLDEIDTCINPSLESSPKNEGICSSTISVMIPLF